MVNGDLVELQEFLDTSSIIDRRFRDDKKYSILMHQFQKIQREIIPSLENLNNTYNAMADDNQNLVNEKEYEKYSIKELIQKQKEKVKVFDLDYHLEKTKRMLKLGEFGTKIADHLSEFFIWEKDSKSLLQTNSIKSLVAFISNEQYNLLMSRVVELKGKFVRSYLYSDALEELVLYEWSLKVLRVLKIKMSEVKEIKQLIEEELPSNKMTKGLKDMLVKQFDCASRLERFYQKCKKEKPTNEEVEKVKESIKGFRINMPKRFKLAKELIHKSSEIKKKIDDFYYKSRPSLEKIDEFSKELNEEPIIFQDILKDLKKISDKCNKLIKKAKLATKGSKDVTKLIKIYKKLNVTCPQFEVIIKEKKIDEKMLEKLEGDVMNLEEMDLDKILTLEAQIEMVDNEDWAISTKAKLWINKIQMLRSAYEGGKLFKIDVQTLKTFMVEGYMLTEKAPETTVWLKKAEEIWKRVRNKLEQLKNCRLEKLQRIKRVLYNCIDVTHEVEDLVLKCMTNSKEGLLNKKMPTDDFGTKAMKKVKTEKCSMNKNLMVQMQEDGKNEDGKPMTYKEKLKGGKIIKASKGANLLKLLEANPKVIKETQKRSAKKESAMEALRNQKSNKKLKSDALKNSNEDNNKKLTSLRESYNPTFINNSSNNNIKEFITINPFTERLEQENQILEESQQFITKPVEPEHNPTSCWQIFDGKFKIEDNNKLFPEIKLHTLEKFDKCTEYPQLPLNLVFRETTDLSDLIAMLEAQTSIINNCTEMNEESSSAFNFLCGYVKLNGLSRNMFNNVFKNDQRDQGVYSLQYASNAKIFILNLNDIDEKWLSVLGKGEDVERMKKIDCDFHFMITSDKKETQYMIEPTVVNKIEYKDESNYNRMDFEYNANDTKLQQIERNKGKVDCNDE